MLIVLAIAVIGLASPAAAAGRSYDQMPMQIVTKGLTAEQHLQRQAELGRRLARELPADALEKAVQIPVTREEINAIETAPRSTTPLRIGLVKALASGIVVAGLDADSLSRTADGGLVWAKAVRSDAAGAIRLHVQDMSLPANAELYVYSRAGQAFGPYTVAGPDFSGDFWTTAVFGSEAILQLRLSAPVSEADLSAVSFRIEEAGIITQGFTNGLLEPDRPLPWERFEKRAGKAATDAAFPCGNPGCVVDATCTNVAAANPAKSATAKIEWVSGAFIYTCTGGLLSDNNPTQNNFFLTANHCLSSSKTAKSVSFYWRYATSSCNGTCPSNSGWPYVTTGASVAASNRKGDFTLMQLTSNPPAGSVLLGWNSAPVANTNGAHLYRISNPNFGPQVYSQHDVNTSAPTCTGWPRGERIYSRDITGATDGGSSGSPVLNASSQVVGQLSGACGTNVNDPCDAASNATVDGAFAFYYSQVQPFLNP
ncbi:MAG TPA: trypsin-like peptidase domain-containing protein [Thermoanaerobaculia bacterium]|jgi:V8-like Glu-specific endopeptidase|nr:trypsin-like peptidase domain-containing protein [Thermoanaerobaculia bacterium]